MIEPTAHDTQRDGQADFDFFIGKWTSRQRRLRERLKGSQEWEEFSATTVARKILGGRGNIDEVSLERPSGRVEGFTMRIYDPTSHQWNIYWADSVSPLSGPLTPMAGEFIDGRGEFYAHELIGGKGTFVRFIWSEITANSCRWEQAFSIDGGKTWETNWIADFVRTE